MTKERIIYLDAARGFAILLVITGHLIQYNYLSSINNVIFNIIYSFHMPLFFFLSGCTDAIKNKEQQCIDIKSLSNSILKKFLTIIVPSITWTLIIPIFFTTDFNFDNRISGFWFLNTLFAIHCIWDIFIYLFYRIKRTWPKGGGVFFIICFASTIVALFIIGIKRISLMYLTVFVIGYLLQKYHKTILHSKWIASILAIIYLLTVGFFKYGTTTAGSPQRVWLEFPLSIMASVTIVTIFSCITNKDNRITNVLATFGRHSLGIYLCSLYFCTIPFISGIESSLPNISQFMVLLLISTVIATCCVLIEKFISPLTILNSIMYGKWAKK